MFSEERHGNSDSEGQSGRPRFDYDHIAAHDYRNAESNHKNAKSNHQVTNDKNSGEPQLQRHLQYRLNAFLIRCDFAVNKTLRKCCSCFYKSIAL